MKAVKSLLHIENSLPAAPKPTLPTYFRDATSEDYNKDPSMYFTSLKRISLEVRVR